LEIIGIYRAYPVKVNKKKRLLKSIFNTYVDIISISFQNTNKVVLDNENIEINNRLNFTDKQIK